MLDEEAPGHPRRHHELGRGERRPGQHHVAFPFERRLQRGVLRPHRRGRRAGERSVVGVAVGLVEADLAVLIGVAGPAQRQQQVVGEVRRGQLVGLLTQLVGGAGGHHRHPGRVEAGHRVEGEVRRRFCSLDAREGAALAGVDDDHGERARQAEDLLAELGERQLLASERDGIRAGVPRVIEDELGLFPARGPLLQPLAQRREGGHQLGAPGVERHDEVLPRIAPGLAQDRRQGGRVALRVAQLLLPWAGSIAADDQRVAGDRRFWLVGPGGAGEGERQGRHLDEEGQRARARRRSKHHVPRIHCALKTREPGQMGQPSAVSSRPGARHA